MVGQERPTAPVAAPFNALAHPDRMRSRGLGLTASCKVRGGRGGRAARCRRLGRCAVRCATVVVHRSSSLHLASPRSLRRTRTLIHVKDFVYELTRFLLRVMVEGASTRPTWAFTTPPVSKRRELADAGVAVGGAAMGMAGTGRRNRGDAGGG